MEDLVNNRKKAEFVKLMGPILNSLRKLGGSGTQSEVADLTANELGISDVQKKEKLKSGVLKFSSQIVWAGQYLAWEELIGTFQGKVWRLTKKGEQTNLTEEQSGEILFKWLNVIVKERKNMNLKENIKNDTEPGNGVSITECHKKELLELLGNLPQKGFEKLSLRLLHESGFGKITMNGIPGDKGIVEGIGILQLNPFVSFKVLFQCRQSKSEISRSQVGDLRNAMIGRADKGIIITIGNFTADAVKEADRDGAPPIELVDGKRLTEMFEKIQLGLIPKTIYEIDHLFFQSFLNPEA